MKIWAHVFAIALAAQPLSANAEKRSCAEVTALPYMPGSVVPNETKIGCWEINSLAPVAYRYAPGGPANYTGVTGQKYYFFQWRGGPDCFVKGNHVVIEYVAVKPGTAEVRIADNGQPTHRTGQLKATKLNKPMVLTIKKTSEHYADDIFIADPEEAFVIRRMCTVRTDWPDW